jgi:sugar phosphate isomerase/epimerase
MIRTTLFALLAVSLASTSALAELPASTKVGEFHAGCQAYTFRKFTLMEALEKIAAAGGKTVEFFPTQKLAPEGDAPFDHNSTPEQRQQVKDKLKSLGLTAYGYGVVKLTNNEAECRQIFGFAKDMGIAVVVSEPAEDAFDLIEKMVKEHDIKMAIHNHPKKPLDRAYRYWDPEYVLSLVKDRDPRMGACADLGHWVRSGIKPADAIRLLKGRIFDSHVKDLTEFGNPKAHDMIWGTGQTDIPAALNAFAEVGFYGPLHAEYEHNWDTNVDDVTQCLAWLKQFKVTKSAP